MKRNHWMILGATLALAASADAAARPVDAPRAMSYDIRAQIYIPDGEMCGHYGTYDGSMVFGLDWAVNGTVVAQDVNGLDWTNDGSPYTIAIGQVSGGSFTAYYSETFYPIESDLACLNADMG